MDFKVIFGDLFLEDLEGIVSFIAAENPTAARRLGEMTIGLPRTFSTLSSDERPGAPTVHRKAHSAVRAPSPD